VDFLEEYRTRAGVQTGHIPVGGRAPVETA
jgi:hypothetical protein